MTADHSRFLAMNHRSLRCEGILGEVAGVFLVVDALAIMGETSGVVQILPDEVERMRVGYADTRYGTHYQCRIWRKGAARPLVLWLAHNREGRVYADIVRGFAALVAQAGGLERVQRGESRFWALFPPVAFALVTAAALGVGWYALEGKPLWQQLIPSLVPAALLLLTIWNYQARSAPRPVRSLAELDRQLPG